MYQGIILLASLMLIVAAEVILRRKTAELSDKLLKILAVIFYAVGFFRLMLSDSFMFVINGGFYGEVFYEVTNPLQTFLRWGYHLNYAILPMAVFFDSRLFRNIASYVCLPFSILSTAFFTDFMIYFLSPDGNGLHLVPWLRYAYFILELVLAISIPVLIQLRKRHVFAVRSKKEWLDFLIATPLIIILMIPVYAPQSLIGYSSLIASRGSDYHVGWIVILLAVTLGIYYAFRFKSYRERRMLIVFLTIVLFFHSGSLFLMGFSIPKLPFQLCNLAAYLYMFAIIGRMPRMFQFCLIANVTGALIAILTPDFSSGAFGFWNMQFLLEHSLVFMIPTLAVGLRVFERPKLASLKYTFIGFSIYFAFCLASGVILNGYSDVTGCEVNYFFLFDLEKAFSFFPMFTFTEKFIVSFGRFEFYPLFVSMIYVIFLLLCVVFYHAFRFFNKMADDHLELRGSAIELYEKRTGKTLNIPKEFAD